jgi:glycosyltransferase involved in cell wall biosynthesis
MRILMLNYEFPPLGGGASPVGYEIAKRLVQRGHTVDVVTMKHEDTPHFEVMDGVNVYRVPCIRRKKTTCETYEMLTFVFNARKTIKDLMERSSYDVCHCHFLIPTGILARWVKNTFGLNYVVTAHGSDVPGFNTDRFNLQHKFTGPLLRAISNDASTIITPSQYLQSLITSNIGSYPTTYIPNGIDTTQYTPNTSTDQKSIILSTGRLLKRKGFHTFIRAVKDIELPFEVHIAGDGPYREELERLAEGSKTPIIFHGWIEKDSPNLWDLYKQASIYVLASEKENASVALLEGMATGNAIITTNVSGCPETVGEAGFVIDYDDADHLRSILENLSTDQTLLRNHIDKGLHRVQTVFDWEPIITQYEAVLTSSTSKNV